MCVDQDICRGVEPVVFAAHRAVFVAKAWGRFFMKKKLGPYGQCMSEVNAKPIINTPGRFSRCLPKFFDHFPTNIGKLPTGRPRPYAGLLKILQLLR